jgi:hypothetical protein
MDSAIMVIQSLVQKYPDVDSKIFIGLYINMHCIF